MLLALSSLALSFLVACSQPDEDIKELDANQLDEVIGTLYVDSTSENDTVDNSSQTLSTESIKANPANINSAIKNEVITTENLENTKDQDISESHLDSEIKTVQTTEDQELELELAQIEAQKIANTPFSEPITESLTPAEAILKEILAANPTIDYSKPTISAEEQEVIEGFCQKIANRLSSVSLTLCRESNHRISPFNTVNGLPIVVTEFAPKTDREPLGKILVIGGTHGDELTSVSTAYKWIANLNKYHTGLFHWHIIPALNADSVLARPATRQNANGVDINRNLPTPDWDKQSAIRWGKLSNDPRKAPGEKPASEPETQWIMHEIATFKPDAIVSIHAPYGILDFDAPKLSAAPKSFGRLQLNLLGTYPGSLGNYAGIQQQIPVLTLELPNAVAMPSQDELNAIWGDMIRWLQDQLSSE